MNLLFYTADGKGAAWLEALARALPEASIGSWPGNAAREADYAIVWKPPGELLHALDRARAVFNLGAGVEAVAEASPLRGEVPIIRLEDAGMAEQMVEYACHAVLRRYRELDAYAAQQRAGQWRPRKRLDKRSFGIGILGVGVMGCAVADALARFGFPLYGWSRTQKAVPGLMSHVGADGLDAVLDQARVLICLLPSTRETRGLLDRRRLSRLPRGACVVNIGRGDILVDDDLIALLDEGHLSGAMLDVFRDEPLPAAHAFWHHPGIVVTPHVSAATLIDESVAQIAAKIRHLEAGLPVTGTVQLQRGY